MHDSYNGLCVFRVLGDFLDEQLFRRLLEFKQGLMKLPQRQNLLVFIVHTLHFGQFIGDFLAQIHCREDEEQLLPPVRVVDSTEEALL